MELRMRIIEQRHISYFDYSKIDEMVRALFKEGWQPLGGVNETDSTTPWQTWVKYEKPRQEVYIINESSLFSLRDWIDRLTKDGFVLHGDISARHYFLNDVMYTEYMQTMIKEYYQSDEKEMEVK